MAKKSIKKPVKKAVKKKAPVKRRRKPKAKSYYLNSKDLATDELLHIKIINDQAPGVAETIGITEERHNELVKIADDAYRTTTTLTSAMEKATKEAKHVNEVGYIMLILCDIRQKLSNPVMAIIQMGMGGPPPPGGG